MYVHTFSLFALVACLQLYVGYGEHLPGILLVKNTPSSYHIKNVHSVRGRREAEETKGKPTITKLHATTEINSRFVTSVVETQMKNDFETRDLEATLYVQFPETAFISNFTMQIGDDLYVGIVKAKKEAQEIYDKARERNETAGIVKSHESPDRQAGMDMFSITTNLAANSSAVFILTYQELLVLKSYYTNYLYIDPMQPVADFSLKVNIDEPQGIDSISATKTDGKALDVVREGNTKASVDYSPSLADQGKGVKGLVKVKYTVDFSCNAGVFKTCSSYFVHYFSTRSDCSLPVMNRLIYFVIDISGSMSGDKMTQTGAAMQTILGLLKPNDKFGIILFDDEVFEWRGELTGASSRNVGDAKKYCTDKLVADGSTNIYDPLKKAIDRLAQSSELKTNSYAPYIIMLTDGEPNHGTFTTPKDIQREIKKKKVPTATLR